MAFFQDFRALENVIIKSTTFQVFQDQTVQLQVKFPVVDKIQPQSNHFATSVENKSTGDSKRNDSSDSHVHNFGSSKYKAWKHFILYVQH